MALDLSLAYSQVKSLKQQSAAASHAAKLLSTYKAALLKSWAGVETDYLGKVLDEQIRACEKLSEKTDALSCDILRAIEEILIEKSDSGA